MNIFIHVATGWISLSRRFWERRLSCIRTGVLLLCGATCVQMISDTASAEISPEKTCRFIGSTYQLVDNPNIEMTFFDDPKKRAGPLFIGFAVSDSRQRLFTGTLGAQNGFPQNSLGWDESDLPKGVEDRNKTGADITFLDKNLNDIFEYDDGAAYAIVDFAHAMYYNGNPLLERHKLTGIVWKLESCGK
jgi:hypothetical protein